jgi:hypothetical protein
MSKNKQKGTTFETQVVEALKANGFPHAERRALHGTADKGDITGTGPLVWECKNHKEIKLSEWLTETEQERFNALADHGILVVKRRGKGDALKSYAVMELGQLITLLREAGYGTAINKEKS